MTAPLRCWARRASDGALCGDAADHIDERHLWGVERVDEYCAPDAGPDGRETAARRIWEVSTRLDLIAFDIGEHSEWVALVRAVAARLKRDTFAAKSDLEMLLERVADGEGLVSEPSDDGSWERAARETQALLSLAADILRPFAGGAR